MPVLFSIDGSLVATTTPQLGGGYAPVGIGSPLGIQMLTFFPGKEISEWGNKAELMITSQVRVGPSKDPAPRRVLMMLKNYRFKTAEPVKEYGGDIYGDRMLHYTRSFAGQRIGITLRGVELDRVGEETWKAITSTIGALGNLALFASASPYLAAAGLATRMANTFVKAFSRNDRLTTQRLDLYFDEENQPVLQAGRYLFWTGGPTAATMKTSFRLTGSGDNEANLLVRRESGELYRQTPYFIVQIDGKPRKEYSDFDLDAGSAELLEKWGDKDLGAAIFQSIRELSSQVNDARQLSEIRSYLKELKKAATEEEKTLLRQKIQAHLDLFSEDNAELIKGLLAPLLT